MAGVLNLGRKSAIYLFLLVITGSVTGLKNVDKIDGYILSDVSELFVAESLSMEATQLSISIGSKVFKFSVLHETCFL